MVSVDEIVDVLCRFCTLLFYYNYYFVLSIIDFFRQFVYPKKKCVKGDIVLITGGAGGLGSLLSKKFIKLGATVVVWDVNDQAMQSLKASVLEETGHLIHCYHCDISSRDEVMRVASIVKGEVGSVSILINNAAIICGKKILEFTEKDIQKSFGINLFSNYWTNQAFLPDMIQKKRGHIVAISSVASKFGVPQMSEYCANKAGMSILMECLSRELHQMNLTDEIHTTSVNCSFISTDMFKHCRLRYPSLVPDLEADYVVERIIQAILCNQRVVMIGRIMYFLIFLFTMIPQKCSVVWDDFIGTNEFMNGYGKND